MADEGVVTIGNEKEDGFTTVVESTLGLDITYRVVRHNKTGVMYAMANGNNFTLLVDATGKPLVYDNNK